MCAGAFTWCDSVPAMTGFLQGVIGQRCRALTDSCVQVSMPHAEHLGVGFGPD